MDTQMMKELAKLVIREDDVNRTRESGFVETSHEVSRSSIRSWRNLSHVSVDEGCFPDSVLPTYGEGAILRTAVSAGGNNLSRTVPHRAAITESVTNYQTFIQHCWMGLIQVQKYAGMLDKATGPANLGDVINLENYVKASHVECLRLKKLNLKTIQPLLMSWSSLLSLVQHDINGELECYTTVRRLRQLMSLIVAGLFSELQEKDKIQQHWYVFGMRRSAEMWDRLLY